MPSPPRPAPQPLEDEYNAAVQAFVRRDHARAIHSLDRLLALVRQSPPPSSTWHDLSAPSSSSPEDQAIKVLKLYVSALTSIYAAPPTASSTLPYTVSSLLPPSPPDQLLVHLLTTSNTTLYPSDPSPILPPPLISTLLLASLKLRPSPPALTFAHHLAEDWLARLPDAFIFAISTAPQGKSPEARRRGEAAREGYLKVVELFVGEVLAREGEWEMARALLEGETVMGSKRKENLYKHLRTIQNRPQSNPASPASSGLLPSPASSGILPPQSPTPNGRSTRSGSTSSSSSERTARPASRVIDGGMSRADGNRKGKGKEEEKRIFVDPPAHPTPVRARGVAALVQRCLPPSLVHQLEGIRRSTWISPLALPIPLAVLLIALTLRRQLRRRPAVAAGAAVAVEDVRARLMRARSRGLFRWIWWYVRWWLGKVAGVWKMGTTITYV